MHYLLFYEVGDDYVARRAAYREQHLAKAWEAAARGELVLGGALADPVDGAVLLFQGDSPEVAATFARSDPYVMSGAVKRWHVREWTTVVGLDAARPVLPSGQAASNPETSGTICRMWRGRTDSAKAAGYVQHAREKVFPALRRIEGHRGAWLLRRAVGNVVEFLVLTVWDSMAAVRRFAGPEPSRAVIEPEARAALNSADETVAHFEIVETTQG